MAIVTGTSPNIGGGIAEELALAGAAVACIDSDLANATDAAAYLVKTGARAVGIQCNVTDEEQVANAIALVIAKLGVPDILVNNAAFFNRKGVLDMLLSEWRAQIDVILSGSFLFTKYAATSMITAKQKGSIINIISTAGHQGEPRNVAYSTAKAGLMNFTQSTAMELASHGIRVNSLTPTATDPSESCERAVRWGRPRGDSTQRVAALESFRLRIPMQELPSPSDYGRAAVFLASDDADMITGIDLRVDAGAIARYWAWDPSMPMR